MKHETETVAVSAERRKGDSTMTLHLVSPNTIHAACARFARRPRVTVDPAKVTCLRCLKLVPGALLRDLRDAQEAK